MTAYATWPENLSIIRWSTVPRFSASRLYTAVPSTFCEEIKRSVSSTSPVRAAVSVSILYLPFWTAVRLPPLGYHSAVNHRESEGVRRNALDEICPARASAQVRRFDAKPDQRTLPLALVRADFVVTAVAPLREDDGAFASPWAR